MIAPFKIANLEFSHNLIQGPLAGTSCAPFRTLFSQFEAPAYCSSEMISAQDILSKHNPASRYLYRAPQEGRLAYQIAGNEARILKEAALRVQDLGADLVDLNCGCPKTKMRKKGAGSALLEKPAKLLSIVESIKAELTIPLTVKIRLQGGDEDISLAQGLEMAGADALIVHGRHWTEGYHTTCNYQQIARIKQTVSIPIIANGDIDSIASLNQAMQETGCDAYMISRAGTGRPWIYQGLLSGKEVQPDLAERIDLFLQHLTGLAQLETEYKAVLQSKTLVRYYFREFRQPSVLQSFYRLNDLYAIEQWVKKLLFNLPS